jgi:hypothetical protein
MVDAIDSETCEVLVAAMMESAVAYLNEEGKSQKEKVIEISIKFFSNDEETESLEYTMSAEQFLVIDQKSMAEEIQKKIFDKMATLVKIMSEGNEVFSQNMTFSFQAEQVA